MDNNFDPNQMNQQPMGGAPAPKKSKTGLIVGIVAGIVVIAAVVVVLVLFVFGGKHDGKYVCEAYSAMGIDMYIDIDGKDFDLVMSYDGEEEKESGTVKFKGDEVIFTVDGEDETGDYDKDSETITLEGMEFTKE